MRHVLLDANLARACANPARTTSAALILDLLQVLADKSCNTHLAGTPALAQEWARHRSSYFISWLAGMVSRERYKEFPDKRVADLEKVVSALPDPGRVSAMKKDLHLTSAAIYHGLPVASNDTAQRKHLEHLAARYHLAGRIQWFSPTDEGWRDWLCAGCVDQDAFSVDQFRDLT